MPVRLCTFQRHDVLEQALYSFKEIAHALIQTPSVIPMQGRAPAQAEILSDSSSSLTYAPVWNGLQMIILNFHRKRKLSRLTDGIDPCNYCLKWSPGLQCPIPGLTASLQFWELIFFGYVHYCEIKNMLLWFCLVDRRQVTLLTCARAGVALFGRNLQNDKESVSRGILVRMLCIVSI